MFDFRGGEQIPTSLDLANLTQTQNEVLTVAYDVLAECETALTKQQWLVIFREKYASPEAVGHFLFALDTLTSFGMVYGESSKASQGDRVYYVMRYPSDTLT
jgi:hypothetical protein